MGILVMGILYVLTYQHKTSFVKGFVANMIYRNTFYVSSQAKYEFTGERSVEYDAEDNGTISYQHVSLLVFTLGIRTIFVTTPRRGVSS